MHWAHKHTVKMSPKSRIHIFPQHTKCSFPTAFCVYLPNYLTYSVDKIQLIIHVPSPPTSSSWYIIGMLGKCLNSTELTELPSFWLLQFKTLASPSSPCLLANQILNLFTFPKISLSSVPSSSLLRIFLFKLFLLIELLHLFATSLSIISTNILKAPAKSQAQNTRK